MLLESPHGVVAIFECGWAPATTTSSLTPGYICGVLPLEILEHNLIRTSDSQKCFPFSPPKRVFFSSPVSLEPHSSDRPRSTTSRNSRNNGIRFGVPCVHVFVLLHLFRVIIMSFMTKSISHTERYVSEACVCACKNSRQWRMFSP